MKRLLICTGLVMTLGLGLTYAASGNVDKKELVCMINDEVLGKPGSAVESNGKTYTTCCEMCKKKIQKEPAKYTQAKDPVSGEKVDKADAFIYGMDGKAYYFASAANRKTFADNPGKFLKK